MLFKRYLFLAACVLLFIFGFIAYFTVARAQMESRFRDERQKYNVEGMVLTDTNNAPSPVSPPTPTPAPIANSTPAPTAPMSPDATSTPTPTSTDSASSSAPAPATSDSSAPSLSTTPPTPASTDTPAPALNPAADPNMIIGPVPPPPSTPDASSTTPNTPITPDGSAPAAPPVSPDGSTNTPPPTDAPAPPMQPPSTMNDSKQSLAPFLVRAAYHPFPGMTVETLGVESSKMETSSPAPVVSGVVTNSASTATNASSTVKSEAPNAESSEVPSAPNNGHATGVEASVIVLLYHQFVAPGTHIPPHLQWTMDVSHFEAEMKYIHDNGYHVVPMSDLIKFLHHEIGLPPNSVVITIDDGYKSAVVYAAPILKKYGYPWTFFIYPDFVTVNEGKGAVSWNDLLALQADGVDIESHSMTHPTLTKHTQKWKGSIHLLSPEEYDEWLTNETLGSKTLLEQKMGKPILSLAYPYGAYNKEVEAKAIAAGYQYIFTVADNPVHSTTDPHSIGRYTITQGVEKDFAAYLRQGALGIADADPAPGGTTSNPRPVITAVLGYAGTLDPNSIETSVRDFGVVKHDFDPKTSTLRLYLPRDLIQAVNLINIRVKDAQTGQIMVANWHFNYEPAGGAATHPPIGTDTNAPSVSTNAAPGSSETPMSAATNVAPIAAIPTHTEPLAKPSTNAAPEGTKGD